jgi:hypothetical protein
VGTPDVSPAISTPYIFGTSVVGPLHVQLNIPCQDACSFRPLPCSAAAIAVCDGLGSASKSDVGARLAANAAVETAQNMLVDPELSGAEIVRTAVLAARRSLEAKAAEDQCPLRDLACTIIIVVARKDQLVAAHIGDGAVVALTENGLQLVSGPGESEYSNEVTPLTSSQWEETLRLSSVINDVRCVAVFTDGCQRAAFRKSANGIEPFQRFFGPIFEYANELPDPTEAGQEIHALLTSTKLCENSEDDKTLVVAVLSRG